MFWKFLMAMVLAAIIEGLIIVALIQFFEWRFFQKANSIMMIYECVYPMIEGKFNVDDSLKVKVKFNYCNCRIKFHNSLEASIKIEILVQRALRNYNIVEYLMGMIGQDFGWDDTLSVKEDLEELCCQMRKLTSDDKEEQTEEKEL